MGRKKKIPIFKKCVTCNNEFNPGKHKEKLNCSKECLLIYNETHKNERMKKTFDAIEKKYGVRSYPQTKNFSTKVKKTKKEKYGDENYNNIKQIKKTLNKKFNVNSVGNIKSNSQKSKKTKNEKYGDENYNNREKAKITILNKYGKDHHLKTKESLDKLKQTNKQKYDVEYTINTEKAKQNLKNKNLIKYNTEYYFSSNKHLYDTLDKKIERIKKVIEDNNLIFDIEEYKKLRTKSEDGSLHYMNYDLICQICDTKFKSSLNKIPVCRNCYPLTSVSKQQQELREFLTDHKIKFLENTRKIIHPLELDFYIPEKNIAIELNGNYFHSEISGNKDKNYHINKTLLCSQNKIKLIHIFEDEWMTKKDIVKSRLKNTLQITTNKIYARNCQAKIVTFEEKNDFLFKNHIQNNDISKINIGLYNNNELISVMTFSNIRLALGNKKSDNTVIELSRFCSKINYNITGGFQKLLKYFISNFKQYNKIITYADCRWSGIKIDDTVYSKNGFNFLHQTKPNYFYMFKNNYFKRYHRFTFNKQKMIKIYNSVSTLTEWEIAKQNNMDRIWDCGSLKFEYIIN